MSRFLGLYRWAMQMKLRMGIYTLALLLCKMVWNAAQGVNYVLRWRLSACGLPA